MAEIKFETRLSGDGSSLSWIEIPPKVMAYFSGRKRVKVKASLNGYGYRTTIFSMGGCCGIPVRKEIREKAKLKAGERVKVLLKEDLEERRVSIPTDLLRALKATKRLYERFSSLSYTHKKEYVNWIITAKRAETRSTRIAKTLEKLRN